MDDQDVFGDEFCVAEHIVVSNETDCVMSLACVHGDLHISLDIEFFFAILGSLVSDVDKDLLMKRMFSLVLGVRMLIGWLRFLCLINGCKSG